MHTLNLMVSCSIAIVILLYLAVYHVLSPWISLASSPSLKIDLSSHFKVTDITLHSGSIEFMVNIPGTQIPYYVKGTLKNTYFYLCFSLSLPLPKNSVNKNGIRQRSHDPYTCPFFSLFSYNEWMDFPTMNQSMPVCHTAPKDGHIKF